MALSENEIQRVRGLLDPFCLEKTTDTTKIEYQIRGNKVSLTEARPLFIDNNLWNKIHVAQFEFNPATEIWTLFWYDFRDRRQPYPTGRNRDKLERLVDEVVNDPTGVFWEF